MNFGQMRDEVFRLLEEDSVSPTIFSQTEIETAINEGYQEVSDATEWYERSMNLELTVDKMYYNLRTETVEEFLAFRRAYNIQTDRWMAHTTYRELDEEFHFWQTNTGDPDRVFVRGLYWLGMHPVPSTSNTFLKIYYMAMPFALFDDADEPEIPREFHHAITQYAAGDLESIAGETEKALHHFSQYAQWEERFKQYVHSRMSWDRMGGLRERNFR